MIYKIKIKHNIPGKTFQLNIGYNEPILNLPFVGINISDTFQVVELTGWNNIPGGIDVSKIIINESQFVENNITYVIKRFNITDVIEIQDVDVEVNGIVIPLQVDLYQYNVTLSQYDAENHSNDIEIYWYKDEQMTQQITDGVTKLGLNTSETSVWASMNIDIFRIEPSTLHFTPENPNQSVDVISRMYRIIIMNTDITPWIQWYKDEACEYLINSSDFPYLFTGEDSIYAVISYIGYKTKTVHLIWDSSLGEGELMSASVKLIPNNFTYSITISPEEANTNASIQWYSDSELTQPISGATGLELTTEFENVWVKVTSEGYRDETVSLYGISDTDPKLHADIEMQTSSIEITAIPAVQWGRTYPNYLSVGSEGVQFILYVSNNEKKDIDYDVSIVNQSSSSTSQNFRIQGNQIKIGNDYSIFIINKNGYSSDYYLNSTSGNFTISSNYSEDVSFTIEADTGTQHSSFVRSTNEYSVFSKVHIIPYSNGNINIDTLLCGMADGAAEISGNSVKSYESGIDCDEIPTITTTYDYELRYNYYLQNVGEQEIICDSEQMFSNINLNIEREYSHFTYSVKPNKLNRLRLGFIFINSSTVVSNNPYSYLNGDSSIYLSTNIQESENIRLIFSTPFITNDGYNYEVRSANVLDTIDLSKHGYTYTINYPKQSSSRFSLYFASSDVSNKITVTSTTGVETTQEIVYNNSILYKFDSNKTPEGNYYYDGFKITIK